LEGGMTDAVSLIVEDQKNFLKYLKSKFPLYHLSNVFFRDIHYGVMNYLMGYKRRLKYSDAEEVTRGVIAEFEKAGILKKVDYQTWLLVYPEFQLPRLKKAS
jgi:hypothetical protein